MTVRVCIWVVWHSLVTETNKIVAKRANKLVENFFLSVELFQSGTVLRVEAEATLVLERFALSLISLSSDLLHHHHQVSHGLTHLENLSLNVRGCLCLLLHVLLILRPVSIDELLKVWSRWMLLCAAGNHLLTRCLRAHRLIILSSLNLSVATGSRGRQGRGWASILLA